MQLSTFGRFYGLVWALSLVIQVPILLLGGRDTALTQALSLGTVVLLFWIPAVAARMAFGKEAAGDRKQALFPVPMPPLVSCVLLAHGVTLGGFLLASLLGQAPLDWSLHGLSVRLGSAAGYGLPELPHVWVLFVAGLLLATLAGITVGAVIVLGTIKGWVSGFGKALYPRMGWRAFAAAGALAALPWAPLVFRFTPSPLDAAFTVVRMAAMGAVIALFAGQLHRRFRHRGLTAIAAGVILSVSSESWTLLFPDAQPALAGPTGLLHAALWGAAAFALMKIPADWRIPSLGRAIGVQQARTKSELLAERARKEKAPSQVSRPRSPAPKTVAVAAPAEEKTPKKAATPPPPAAKESEAPAPSPPKNRTANPDAQAERKPKATPKRKAGPAAKPAAKPKAKNKPKAQSGKKRRRKPAAAGATPRPRTKRKSG